ncbi:orotidine-5'-phosphate decarboxylase [Methanosalsum natronophilum]|uniref:orotidine-5'-phosphate decarboxylase n=1 Tax=Methanosalsum natronophilum TaxID=768733 RepID=UPI00216963E9|nr:orotidine-5'-phosphate decarboxylase [Methanosalsum natronophilum]MCS3924737.1 orotidine-5'-phosphate decarboxylase [Methanosalsum natronophilum]
MEKRTRLILSLDVVDQEEAFDIVKKTYMYVDAIKVGYPLILGSGIDIISKIADYCEVIADFKVADIPNTSKIICEHVFNAGADAVIVHAFPGRDSLKSCIEVAEKFNKEIYVVVEMSHPGAIDFFQDISDELAKTALEQNATGVVAPATRPESLKRIRKIIGSNLKIISPGVGSQGGKASDAIRAGADWIIVGRSIYGAQDPAQAASFIMKEIANIDL